MPDNYPLFEDKFPTPSVVGFIVMLSLECKWCYGIITFWMCNFNLVLKRFLFNEKRKKINYRKRVEHDNC